METETIYTLSSLYRDDLRVKAYHFGSGKKSVCVVGAMRGNEVQQIYACSLLIKELKKLEADHQIRPGFKITVIPCCNSASINTETRFWPQDDTDINRMFPGYNLGETTQRIAHGIFNEISNYDYGIQFTSFYIPGEFATHIRMMNTGLEDLDVAKSFGLPYIVVRKPRPYDTTTLNYNWQIWDTKAYSFYTKETDIIDQPSAKNAITCILRFLHAQHITSMDVPGGFISQVILEEDMLSLKCEKSGFLQKLVEVEQEVKKGDLVAQILDPYENEVIEKIVSPCDGKVFFMHAKPLVYSHTAVIKIQKT